jgi:predicted ATPase
MRVNKVAIENFKQFESVEVELREFDCLVGANNSGKTTLLQALALFDFCIHHCLQRRNGEAEPSNSSAEARGRIELRNRTVAPEEFYVLPVSNPMDIWTDRKTMQGGKQRRIRVTVVFDNGRKVTATVKLDFNRFGVSIEPSDNSQEFLLELLNFRIAYLPVFSMFLPREERRLSAAIEDELGRGRVHAVIRNLLLEIKNQGHLDSLTEILRRSFPALQDMEIRWDEVTDRYITVTYHEQGRPKDFDIFSSGSGFQQFLYLFGFVLLKRPNVILLDEPDVHLHGSLQGVMLTELRRLVEQGKQVLMATHSREMITRLSPESILALDRGRPARLAVAFDVYDTLDRLGSLDPSQLTIIQAYRRVVVVEDRSDRDLLSVLCAKCLGQGVWQQVERRVAFCFAKGNPWKQHDMAKLRALLQQMIAVTGPALELFAIADRDYHPDPVSLKTSLPAEHIRWHIWERTEIENYLLHLPTIARLVGGAGQQTTFDENLLKVEFEKLLDASRNSASDRMVQAFDEIRRRLKEPWDAATMARMAREFLEQHWPSEKVALADAKDVVLPGLKRWLQDQGWGQFSDIKLAEMLRPEDLPQEIHGLAKALADFAGVRVT